MQKVIDLGLEPPASTDEIARKIRSVFLEKEAQGMANYRRIFGPRWAAAMGTSLEEIDAKRRELTEAQFLSLLDSVAQMLTVSPEAFVKELDAAGIEWGLVDTDNVDKTAAFVRRWPERFKGMALLNPFQGMKAVRELERAVRELGMVALYASPFDWKIRASDPLFFPLYAKAAELGIPVFIYTAMNYNTELPMDIARPLHLDAVAMAFPDLKIVADCGGWPWVPELVGLARRHRNVYINTSSHRPKHLATPGSGWEMLMQFGNTLLQDQVVFASGAGDLGLP
ncbi:MAG: amidohydrolase family protein, partial [Chloroflexi bacterium]|nr:amidohydrolase family protein [Chloroflexota bacterium]